MTNQHYQDQYPGLPPEVVTDPVILAEGFGDPELTGLVLQREALLQEISTANEAQGTTSNNMNTMPPEWQGRAEEVFSEITRVRDFLDIDSTLETYAFKDPEHARLIVAETRARKDHEELMGGITADTTEFEVLARQAHLARQKKLAASQARIEYEQKQSSSPLEDTDKP